MFFTEKVTCPPVEKSCISQAASLVLFHFGPIPTLGYIGATFPRAISTSENAFFYKIVEQLSTRSHDKFQFPSRFREACDFHWFFHSKTVFVPQAIYSIRNCGFLIPMSLYNYNLFRFLHPQFAHSTLAGPSRRSRASRNAGLRVPKAHPCFPQLCPRPFAISGDWKTIVSK